MESEDNGGFAISGCVFDFFSGCSERDEVGVFFEPFVPLLYIEDSFAEHFVVCDSDMDGIEISVSPLFEDFWRPVAVLEAIDEHGYFPRSLGYYRSFWGDGDRKIIVLGLVGDGGFDG